MADTRDLLVRIKGDTKDFESSMKGVKRGADDSQVSFMKLTGAVAAGQAIFEGAKIAFSKGVDVVQSSIKQYEEAETAQKELANSVLNVSKGTQEQLKATNDLADSLSAKGVLDDDVIRKGLAQLSTFGLTNDSVRKLGKSMADLTVNQFGVSASGDQAVQSANIMAKALNGNFGALEKMGIHLTDAQKNLIKYGNETQRVDTINQVMAANLRTNQATALETTEGKMAHLHVAIGNLQESFGGIIVSAITPFVTKLSDFVSSDKFQDWVKKVTPIIQRDLTKAIQFLTQEVLPKLIDIFKFIIQVGKNLLDFYEHHRQLVKFVAEAILALVVAFKVVSTAIQVVTAVTKIWQALAMTNPWLLAITLIIAAILLIITHWSTVKQWIEDFWKWIKNVFDDIVKFIKAHWDLLLDILLGPIGFVIGELIKHWSTIKQGFSDVINWVKNVFRDGWNFVVGLWQGIGNVFHDAVNGIKTAFGKVTDVVTSPFKAAFNGIAHLWNDSIGKLHFKAPSWVPGIGGKGFDMPNLPYLAQGGIVDQATLAMIGEGNEPEAVMPLSKIPQMVQQINQGSGTGNGSPVTINLDVNVGMYAGMPVEKREIALELWKELVRAARAQGVQLPMIGAVGVQ